MNQSNNTIKKTDLNFVFFGTDHFSVDVLNQLKKFGFLPGMIVTVPDRPSGRGQKTNEPLIKIWADQNNIECKQPEKLDEQFISELKISSKNRKNSINQWQIFIVASYGKIIPKEIIDMPEFGSLNVHPSLLPLYRGASPIESAMLDDANETGVTIMLMDEKMDHGPILNREIVRFDIWPTKNEVEKLLAQIGGKLLAETINPWISGKIQPQEQEHAKATFTKKITKEMGEVSFSDIEKVTNGNINSNYDFKIAKQIFLKIQALNPWPSVFFFHKHNNKNVRVKITTATYNDNHLKIEKVLPEGKKEISFESFQRGYFK